MADAFETVSSGYDRIGARYQEWSQGSPVRLRWVDWLLGRLSPDSVLVDLGCGSGEPATRRLAERHQVVGVDASAEQLLLARSTVPTACLVRADMTRLALRPGSVDAVVSFYALGHAPPDCHAPLFTAISRWLRPGGLLLTSAPLTAGEGIEEDWLGVPMYFGGVGEMATRQALVASGLVEQVWEIIEEDEGDGRRVRFLWIVAGKPSGG